MLIMMTYIGYKNSDEIFASINLINQLNKNKSLYVVNFKGGMNIKKWRATKLTTGPCV